MVVENSSSLFGRLGSFARAQDTDTRSGEDIPSLAPFQAAPRAYFLTDSLSVIIDSNAAARELAHKLGGGAHRGARITSLLRDCENVEAVIYRSLRQSSTDGSAIAQFDKTDQGGIGWLRAEISDCGNGEYFLWCFDPQKNDARGGNTADLVSEALPFGQIRYDAKGEIFASNARFDEWAAQFGAPATTLEHLFGPEGAATLVAGQEADTGFTTHPLSARGTRLSVHCQQDADGNFLGYLVPDESKPIERVSEVQRLVRLLDDGPVAVAVTDLEGLVIEANDRLASMSGGAARNGAEIALAVRLEDREDVGKRIAKVAEGGTFGKPLDIKLTGAAGKEHAAHFHAHRIQSDEGNLIFAYLMDISERKLVEQQLAQAQKMQAVGKLAGGIAHDVNNVLTAIRGHCDLLMLKQVAGDPGFGSLTQIKAQTERAAEVIKQLLAFSRQQTMRREIVDITEQIDKTRFMLNPLVTERVQVKTSHGHDLWRVRIDPNEFERVLINLAVNACDAMPTGGTLTVRTRNIDIEASRKITDEGFVAADYVLVEVSDTGAGMPPEILAKMFEPFFTTKEVGKGTGLGLSTVYGIIKQMSGFIYCDSVEGAGTTFRIYLPQYKGAVAEDVPVISTSNSNVVDLSGNGCILLVEDEEAVRSFAVKALELRGYEVRAAASGEEAIELVEEDPDGIDLVVSDVVMPEMTGPEMMRIVRKMRPEIQFLFVSGYAEEALREQTVEEEEFEFLAKPFSLKDLAVKVKEVINAGA